MNEQQRAARAKARLERIALQRSRNANRPNLTAQQDAEVESRTARYSFLGIEGSEHTDPQGRVSAIARFRYEPMEITDGQPKPTGERYDVRVQVYKEPGYGWLPVEGYAGVRAAALALPARTGRKVLRGPRARWGDRDRAAEVQAYFDRMGRAPLLDAEKTRAVAAAARETDMSESHVWRMLRDGSVHFSPGDEHPGKESRTTKKEAT